MRRNGGFGGRWLFYLRQLFKLTQKLEASIHRWSLFKLAANSYDRSLFLTWSVCPKSKTTKMKAFIAVATIALAVSIIFIISMASKPITIRWIRTGSRPD